MRVLLILVSFLLVGCAKEPTYLKCDKVSDDSTYWIVLDHQNSLFITALSEKDKELYVYANILRTDGKYYWGGREKRSSYTSTLSRTTLKYRDGFSNQWQCEITDDLSYLRDLGVEKARIKI